MVIFDDTPVSCRIVTKFLGVLIVEKLSWQPHINYSANKIARNAAVLHRVRYKINAEIILTLYDTTILLHVSYCAMIWASVSDIKLKKSFAVQKRVLRLVVLVERMSRSKSIFYDLKRLVLSDIYKL